VLGGVGHSDNAMQGTAAIAVDNNGTIWVPQPGLNALTAIIADYTPMSGSPLKSAALVQPVGVAIDGATTVWVTNGGDAGSLTAVNGDTGVAVPGASLLGALQAPYGVAVDGSGYVWTANTGSDTVSVFVGVAAPALVPIVARF
jgi:DNA-binding beta-propeller fold protein YncE